MRICTELPLLFNVEIRFLWKWTYHNVHDVGSYKYPGKYVTYIIDVMHANTSFLRPEGSSVDLSEVHDLR